MWYWLTLFWFPPLAPLKTKYGRATRYEYDARAVSAVGVAYRCVSSVVSFFLWQFTLCAEWPAPVRISRSAMWLSLPSSHHIAVRLFVR